MKLGYQTNTWGGVSAHPLGITSIKDLLYVTPGSISQAIREIADLGYQGFELFDGNLMALADRGALEPLMQATGLELAGVYCGGNFIFAEILPEEIARIEQASLLAARYGAKNLIVGGGAVRAAGRQVGDEARLADGLNQVVALARRHGLTASYHPHHGTLVETPAQIARLFNLTEIAFCPDTGHLLEAGGDPATLIRQYGQRVGYVHLKDFSGGDFRPLGQGEVDFAGIWAALKDIGYSGWVTAELDTYGGPPKVAAEIAMQHMLRIRSIR